MKILFINSVYEEKSTGALMKSIRDYAEGKGHETRVLYGRGGSHPPGKKIQGNIDFLLNVFVSRITGRFWNGPGKKQTKQIISEIESFKPDVINIHQLYGYYLNPSRLIAYLAQRKIKTVITLHDFTLMSGKCGYPLRCNRFKTGCGNCPRKHEYPISYFIDRTQEEYEKKEIAFRNQNNFTMVPVSEWLEQSARASRITKNCAIRRIDNGIDSTVYRYSPEDGLPSSIVAVVCSNFKDKIKGYPLLIDTINETHLRDRTIKFALIGTNSDFIKKKVSYPDGVISLGRLIKEQIKNWYNFSFCALIPSESETFSMPTAEALCSGVPVIGPKGCGAPEFLFDSPYANFSFDRDGISIAKELCLLNSQKLTIDEREKLSEKALRKFGINYMAREYVDLFGDILKHE